MNDTNALLAAIRANPPGTFKLYRATEDQPEVEQSMQNREEIAQRVAHARASGCLIEVVSLRMQYMDIWLRTFFENSPHEERRRREFGGLLDQCLSLGLDKDIYSRINTFNKHRIKAIHGYLVGLMKYADLEAVVAESDGLSEALVEFVLINSGEPVTEEFENQYHKRGDKVFHLQSTIDWLRGAVRI